MLTTKLRCAKLQYLSRERSGGDQYAHQNAHISAGVREKEAEKA